MGHNYTTCRRWHWRLLMAICTKFGRVSRESNSAHGGVRSSIGFGGRSFVKFSKFRQILAVPAIIGHDQWGYSWRRLGWWGGVIGVSISTDSVSSTWSWWGRGPWWRWQSHAVAMCRAVTPDAMLARLGPWASQWQCTAREGHLGWWDRDCSRVTTLQHGRRQNWHWEHSVNAASLRRGGQEMARNAGDSLVMVQLRSVASISGSAGAGGGGGASMTCRWSVWEKEK